MSAAGMVLAIALAKAATATLPASPAAAMLADCRLGVGFFNGTKPKEWGAAAHCMGYLIGMAEGARTEAGRHSAPEPLCYPATLKKSEFVVRVTQEMEKIAADDRRGLMKERANALVYVAMTEAYPCKR